MASVYGQGGKKTSPISMAYHDLTCRYNGYFNAKLILNQAIKNHTAGFQEDYTSIIPLSPAESENDMTSIYPELDNVIKKSSIAIRLHENSKWVDNCYYLIGKAKYYRGDYDEALKTFQVITSDFSEGKRKYEKRKKVRKRQKKEEKLAEKGKNLYYDGFTSFMKHKPSKYDAMIWMVKCYSALGKYSEAASILSIIEGDKSFPSKLRLELDLAKTAFYMGQKDYASAAEAIKQVIENTKKREHKIRYHYVLAQLYEQSNQNKNAIEGYNKVVSFQPDIEMEFNAKLKVAILSRKEQYYSEEEIRNLLFSMLKNDNYERFKSKVYYTLAGLELSSNNKTAAIDYLNKSITENVGDNSQLTASYLKLAEIYFGDENYVKAKAYHDSTLSLMDAKHEVYAFLENRRNILSEMVQQLNIIAVEDSLQRIAVLSPEDRLKLLEKIKEAERQKELEVEDNTEQEFLGFEEVTVTNSNWPFDNPQLRGTGFSEFRNAWGNRPNEDNWRRSEKSTFINITEENIEENTEEINTLVGNDPEDFFKDVPLTEQQMEASNNRLIEAYYALANIYKDKLNNREKSTATYEALLERFPDNKYRLESLFSLFLYYQEIDPKTAEKYKGLIMNEFPKSFFASIVSNPNFKASDQDKEVNNYYRITYEHFLANDLETVLARKAAADSLFPESSLSAKFDMLVALTYGKLKKFEIYKAILENIVHKYPETEIQVRAVEMLNALESLEYENKEISLTETEVFTFEPEEKHYLLMLFYEISPEVQTIKNATSDYNMEFHSLKNIQIQSILLNNEIQMLVIKDFEGSEDAKDYYNQIRYSQRILGEISKERYSIFVISENNYGVFFRKKNIDAYLAFFSDHYLASD